MKGFSGKRDGSLEPLKYKGFPRRTPPMQSFSNTILYLCHGYLELLNNNFHNDIICFTINKYSYNCITPLFSPIRLKLTL